MKRSVFVVGWVLIVLLGGCSVKKAPCDVVEEYYKAIRERNKNALAKIAFKETAVYAGLVVSKNYDHVVTLGFIREIKERYYGVLATVTVTFEEGAVEEFFLVDFDANGRWKVMLDQGSAVWY